MLFDGDVRTTIAGFVGALSVLGILFWIVGIDQIVATLAMARSPVLVAVSLVAFLWLSAWSQALRTVLGVLGVSVSKSKAFLIFAAATFANNVTPFGQAGGEPFSALLISRSADAEYETGLAAIASVDALNFVPSIGFGLVGVAYFTATVTLGRRLELAALSIAALALLVPIAAYLGWQHRYRLEAIAVRFLSSVLRTLIGFVPGRSPPTSDTLRQHIEGFFRAIERVATDGSGLLLALSFSAIGWLLLASSLWLSLFSLGHAVPIAAVLFVVPVGSIAGITPLPGGLGGVETVLILLLVPTTGVSPATASAAVLIHRTATYWLPVLIGGGATAALGATRVR